MKSRVLCLFLLASAVLSINAVADTLKVVESVTASGFVRTTDNLSGVEFSDALVTFTYFGDTSNTSQDGTYNSFGSETTTVAGLGTYTNTGLWSVNVNHSGAGSFAELLLQGIRPDGGGGLAIVNFDPLFETYLLTSDLGPVVTPTTTIARGNGAPFVLGDYTNGSLLFNSFGKTTTYQATVATTPEPSCFILLGTGLLGIVGMVRRRSIRG